MSVANQTQFSWCEKYISWGQRLWPVPTTLFCLGCRPYILPERYTVSFTDDGNAEELRPKGILFVKVIEAVDVPRMDLFSDSDPYARCQFPSPSHFTTFNSHHCWQALSAH